VRVILGNASGNSPLITVVTNQSNIDNYGNVGTIRISTTGNNKIFRQVTENTSSNDIHDKYLFAHSIIGECH
jgi:hypothetical protein